MRAAQVQRAENKRARIEARLRPACWNLQQEFAADWNAMPAMAEGVQAFLMHAVALPYGSSVSFAPYLVIDTGNNEPHGENGDISAPAHDLNELTGCGIGAALGASAAQLTTAARVERSLLLGARMWADTNYDALAAALRPRRPPSKDDYVPPGRGRWRYGGMHDEGEGQHTSTPSNATLPYTETWGDRKPTLPDALFGDGGNRGNRGNPCSVAVPQHLACNARPPPPRDTATDLHVPQPCGSGYDPRHAPSPLHPCPYGTTPQAPSPRMPPTFDGPPQPPPHHPHPHLHPHAESRLNQFQAPVVPHPHPAAYPGVPPPHLYCSFQPAPPHHAPSHVKWNARPVPPEPEHAGMSPCRIGRRERSLDWEQGRKHSRSRSSSPSPQGRSLHRPPRSPPSRSRSHSRGRRHSPRRQWDSDRSQIGRHDSKRRGREYKV